MEYLLYILGILFFIMLQGFFACSEMSIVSSNRLKIHYLAKKGDKNAKIIEYFYHNSHKFLGTTLVGVNLSVVTSSALTAALMIKFFDNFFPEYKSFQPIVSTILIGPFVLLFGEIIPLTLGRLYNNHIALRVSKIIILFYHFLYVVIFFTTNFAKFLGKITGTLKNNRKLFSNIDELKLLFEEGTKEGALKKDDLFMITRIFNFNKNIVKDIMSPLINVQMISADDTITNLIKLFKSTGYSKIPVYRDRIDNVIGIVNIKGVDLSKLDISDKIETIITKPYFIPETKPIKQLLQEMKVNLKHFAVVVDEFGGVSGVVTIEDIIEEIIGEIEDEHKIVKNINEFDNKNKTIELDGNVELETLTEQLNIIFDTESDVGTIAGYILDKLGKIPKAGVKITETNKYEITIIDADDRRINRVRIDIL
ncbi:HlyC/CorC family transporter [Candidatus Dependentiae bacterium]|nr:HlyC/CorC family transporter [Candidatus Dependentiae bacterium]